MGASTAEVVKKKKETMNSKTGYLKIHRGEKRMKLNEGRLQDIENYLKGANLKIIEVQEGAGHEQRIESLTKR